MQNAVKDKFSYATLAKMPAVSNVLPITWQEECSRWSIAYEMSEFYMKNEVKDKCSYATLANMPPEFQHFAGHMTGRECYRCSIKCIKMTMLQKRRGRRVGLFIYTGLVAAGVLAVLYCIWVH